MAEAQAFTGTKKLSRGGGFPTPRVPWASFSPGRKAGCAPLPVHSPYASSELQVPVLLHLHPALPPPLEVLELWGVLTQPGSLVNCRFLASSLDTLDQSLGAGWENVAQEPTFFISSSECSLMTGPQRFLTWGCLHLRAEMITH